MLGDRDHTRVIASLDRERCKPWSLGLTLLGSDFAAAILALETTLSLRPRFLSRDQILFA
jgi:hypothetical protein